MQRVDTLGDFIFARGMVLSGSMKRCYTFVHFDGNAADGLAMNEKLDVTTNMMMKI